MPNTITGKIGAVTIGSCSPSMVLTNGLTIEHESRSEVRDFIGGGVLVIQRTPRPRAGRMKLLFPSETAAEAALDLHGEADTLTLVCPSRPSLSMTYIINGVTLQSDSQTQRTLILEVQFQKVTP